MLYIASDHAGFALKEILTQYLRELGEHYTDLGPDSLNPDDDYSDYAAKLAEELLKHDGRGILICANAIGVCIVANKFRGIRAGIGYSVYAARSSREDDATNVLCLPGRFLNPDDAKEILHVWLTTPFSQAPRHERRIGKIGQIEREHMK